MDSEQLVKENEEAEEDEELYRVTQGIKKAFINPRIIEETGEPWNYEEGCLSIPDVRVKISRKELVRIRYVNEQFEEIEETYDGMNARIIQHEYDHLEGILLTDHESAEKSLLKGKLDNISKGQDRCELPHAFSAALVVLKSPRCQASMKAFTQTHQRSGWVDSVRHNTILWRSAWYSNPGWHRHHSHMLRPVP